MKVYEGTILTVDARDSVARYLVEDTGIIRGDTLHFSAASFNVI